MSNWLDKLSITYNNYVSGGSVVGGTGSTAIVQGSNITTGGSITSVIVNVADSPSFNNLTLSGSAYSPIITGGTIFSGGSDVSTLFVSSTSLTSINSQLTTKANLSGATFTGTVNGTGISATTLSGGTHLSGSTDISTLFVAPSVTTTITSQLATKANLSGATFTGTVNGTGISATTLSGATHYSGSSDISTLFVAPAVTTLITSQLATKANLSGSTFTGTVNGTGISATTLSGGTLYSGSSELGTLFAYPSQIVDPNVTGNLQSGGTAAAPIFSVVDSPNFNGLVLSGTGRAVVLSATTISGSTYLSGSTDISTLFVAPAVTTTITSQLATKANLSGATFTSTVSGTAFSGTSVSGGTLYSGSSDVSTLFVAPAATTLITSQLATKANLSGSTFTGTVNGTGISATTLSGATHYSGSSDISTLFVAPAVTTTITSQLATKANLSGATFTGTVSGTAFSGTSISGASIFSGSTDLGNLFALTSSIIDPIPQGNIQTGGTAASPIFSVVDSPSFAGIILSGAGIASRALSFSSTTLSGGTLLSGSTEISTLFKAPFNYSVTGQNISSGAVTLITGTSISIPSTKLRIGTTFEYVLSMTKSASGTTGSILQWKVGTAGTSADTTVLAFQMPTGSAAADTARTDVYITIRGPLTSSCIAQGMITMSHNLATTGFNTIAGFNATVTSGAFDATTTNLITGLYCSCAASTALVFPQATVNTINLI